MTDEQAQPVERSLGGFMEWAISESGVSSDCDDAVRLLHPIIEGVGVGGWCRWSTPGLCPHHGLARAAARALDEAGLLRNPPGAPCRICLRSTCQGGCI